MATMGGSFSSSSGTSGMLLAISSYNIAERIGKLKETRERMLATLADAEEMVIWKESVKLWLRELRGLAYDAEDLIEEYDYEVHHHQVCGSYFSSTDAASMGFPDKIESVEERFCTLGKQRESLGLDGDGVRRSTPSHHRSTGSFLTEPRVYGREGDKERVLESLLSDVTMENGIPVVSIVGMGGIGKTTLAQLLYKEVGDGFARKAWVHVSEDYDVIKLAQSIMQCFTRKPCQLTELSVLQEEMIAAVRNEKVLLVLDDLWNVRPDLQYVLAPLRESAPGSKLLVTTRSEGVGKGMKNLIDPHRLELLSDDDCWSLFQHHAFSGRDDQRHLVLLNMEEVRTKVAEKCKGLPLAAKTLGGLLRYEGDERRWMYVLGSDFPKLDRDGGEYSGITWVLKLSYIHLLAHLKPCFACCSVFPKGYEISRDELVYMWMAHGLVQDQDGVPAFDVGMEYIKELLWRSLLQIPRYQSEKEEKIIMHDLIHDLAHDILEGERPKEERSSKRPRYKKKTLMAHGRVFVQQPSKWVYPKSLERKFSDRRNLRALSFYRTGIRKLPESVGDLKHIRYIELRGCHSLESLPESVCKLYNLQILCLPPKVAELPQNFKNLTNLQHLVVGNERLMFPPGFGRLTKLQHLSYFDVSEEREKYASIGELGQLTNLRGGLQIRGLHNLASPEEASSACLGNKEHLNSLELRWKEFSLDDVGEDRVEVLEALRPHANLSKLGIYHCPGTRLPSWLGHPSFQKMSFLELSWYSCGDLPALGELPNLRELTVEGFKSVKCVGSEFYRSDQSSRNYDQCFPSLRSLSFFHLKGLEDWTSCGCRFTELRKLEIRYCHSLVKILCDFPNLTELFLLECLKLVAFPKMPLIRELNVDFCWSSTLPEELQSLEVLRLKRLANIKSLPLYKLPALERLTISNCMSLERIEFTPPSHVRQQFDHASTSTISATSSCKLSLKSMELTSCPKLDFSTEDQLPTTLKEIKVKDCSRLKKWCTMHRDTKLAHVKEVYLADN